MTKYNATHIATISCPDDTGLVSAFSKFLSDQKAFIIEANHFSDKGSGLAFLRFAFKEKNETMSLQTWQKLSAPIKEKYKAEIAFYNAFKPMKVVIAVSKFGHCLHELIHRWKAKVLPIEICAIISNHEDMRSFAEWAEIPYHYLPVTKDTKLEQEKKIREIFKFHDAELLILARYMQILSSEMCADFQNKAINIHHSFLPSFKGAKPYSQAHEKGVKIIGATAHYVTSDLDEGPIIEQAVERVDHSISVEEFTNIGRDTETMALIRAVRWHAEHRVMINGIKTVVFK